MAIESQPQPLQLTDPTGLNQAAVSIVGQLQVTDDVVRRVQELILLTQQASLLSVQLAGEKIARYTFQEIR